MKPSADYDSIPLRLKRCPQSTKQSAADLLRIFSKAHPQFNSLAVKQGGDHTSRSMPKALRPCQENRPPSAEHHKRSPSAATEKRDPNATLRKQLTSMQLKNTTL
jgi:hypothetical protein